MRDLASIQRIHKITPMEYADNLELAHVLGWHVCVKKGEFKEGDLCVYFEIDSMLPEDNSNFDFLKNSKGKIKRIKTREIRGELSQGLVMPLDIIESKVSNITEGLDVTDLLNVKKYDPTIYDKLTAGNTKGNFPDFIIKTDETRIQSILSVLDELKDQPYYITQKEDGTSMTIYQKDGKVGVCSRNLEIKEGVGTYWEIAKKYNIPDKLTNLGVQYNYAIQGELVGPGIQKNKMGLKEKEFHIFNVFDIDTRHYLNYLQARAFCYALNLPMVKLVERRDKFNYTLDELKTLACSLTYENTETPAEGIVVRPQNEMYSRRLHGNRLSFKVISDKFLLKFG